MAGTKVELSGAVGSPLIHFAPANGFPAHTYLPLLRRLHGYRSLCFPPRALWGDQAPPRDRRGWRQTADDLLAGFAQYDWRNIIAIGHSFGGVASMLALIDQPSRFNALIMLDPVLLPPSVMALQQAAWDAGKIDQQPLVRRALRRRRVFDSRAEAFARFRDKAVFADWPDEALWLYVEHGLRERDAGAGFELRWDTAWEAYYFSVVYERVWQDLPRLNGLAPTLIVRAGESHTFPRESLAPLQSLLPAADLIELAGQGHLFPLAAPAATARVICDWLAAL